MYATNLKTNGVEETPNHSSSGRPAGIRGYSPFSLDSVVLDGTAFQDDPTRRWTEREDRVQHDEEDI